MSTVYICEKPSQARDIAKVLGCHQKGDGFLTNGTLFVTWCFGHLLESAPPDYYCANIKPWRLDVLPIVPELWKMEIKKEGSKQVKAIKELVKKTTDVVVATDADREGEVIARELLDLFKYKGGIRRLWLSALDDASIKKALANIKDGKVTEHLYHAGLGRQRADWLIGMNLTMAASVSFGKYGEGVLSVGRVQTPTLKLVVDRDAQIEAFRSKPFYELLATFKIAAGKDIVLKWQAKEEQTDEAGRILDQTIVSAIAAKIDGKTGVVVKFDDVNKKTSAPLCLSLSKLQKIASAKYGFSAKETLETAQVLYETHKAITYPRTDCEYLPENQFLGAVDILAQLKQNHPALLELLKMCSVGFKSSVWNDKKITAHHAMIPTLNANVSIVRMSDKEKKLYDLVCRYYLAQFLGEYEYAERSVLVECEEETFKAASQTPLSLGWKRALTTMADQESDEPELPPLPKLDQGEAVTHTNSTILSKETKPPARFTEGTLIEAMKSIGKLVKDAAHKKILKETAGIGTEATRASIIETLFRRNYLEKKGKAVQSTEKGRKLISVLPTIVSDPVLTAQWEQDLDRVSEGNYSLSEFCASQHEMLCSTLKLLNPSQQASPSRHQTQTASAHNCPQCRKLLIRRLSKKDSRAFWGCSGFPACRYTATDHNNQPINIT
jgi:DNA topoisomerase-3